MPNAIDRAPIDYHFSLLLLSCLWMLLQSIVVMVEHSVRRKE